MLVLTHAYISTVCLCAHAHAQEWWTHLWLNEGFASWIEYLCVDHCFKEFDIWTQFASSDYTRALDLDALKNSHPIEVSQHRGEAGVEWVIGGAPLVKITSNCAVIS